jgi:hypothetical protein
LHGADIVQPPPKGLPISSAVKTTAREMTLHGADIVQLPPKGLPISSAVKTTAREMTLHGADIVQLPPKGLPISSALKTTAREMTLHGADIVQPPPKGLPISSVLKKTAGTITTKLLNVDFLSKLPLQQSMKQKSRSRTLPQQLQQIKQQEQKDSTTNKPSNERHLTDPKIMDEAKSVLKSSDVWTKLQQPWLVSNLIQPKIDTSLSKPVFVNQRPTTANLHPTTTNHRPITDACTEKAPLSTANSITNRFQPSVLPPIETIKAQQDVTLMRGAGEWQSNVSIALPSHCNDTIGTHSSDTTNTKKRKLDCREDLPLVFPSSKATSIEHGAPADTAASTTITETIIKSDGATSFKRTTTTTMPYRIKIDVKKYRPTVVSTDSLIDITCVLCQDSKAQIIFLPCLHCILCVSCCNEFDYCSPPVSSGTNTSNKFCPTCRVPIQSIAQPKRAVLIRPRICSSALFF